MRKSLSSLAVAAALLAQAGCAATNPTQNAQSEITPQAPALPEPAVAISNPFASVAPLVSCLAQTSTLVGGHRGGVEPGYPENALETFAHAVSENPIQLEIDVRTTRDGVMVLMHDATIERTTTGQGAISDLTFAEIQAATLEDSAGQRTEFRVPTFEATIDWAKGRALLLADVKEDDALEAMAAAVGAQHAQPVVAFIVYSLDQAQRLHRADPQITMLYPAEHASDLDALEASGVPLDNVVAWTGVRQEQPEEWRAIRARGVPIAFGTMFIIDPALAQAGDDSRYLEISRQGAGMLGTDRHRQAFDAIQQERDGVAALRRCHAAS